MNKTETVNAISQTTGIGTEKCTGIVDAMEAVLTHELEGSGGVRNFFDLIYLLLDFLKPDSHTGQKTAELVEKIAYYSETGVDETQKVLDALIDILNRKIETSRSAKVKFKFATRLANFFKHK